MWYPHTCTHLNLKPLSKENSVSFSKEAELLLRSIAGAGFIASLVLISPSGQNLTDLLQEEWTVFASLCQLRSWLNTGWVWSRLGHSSSMSSICWWLVQGTPGATDLLQLLHSPGSSAIPAKQKGSFSLPAWRDIYIVAPMPAMSMPREESDFSWGCCSC